MLKIEQELGSNLYPYIVCTPGRHVSFNKDGCYFFVSPSFTCSTVIENSTYARSSCFAGANEGLHVARVERASDLTQELCDHLVALDLRTDALDDVLRDMEGRHGDEAYGELLWILTNLRFDSGEAKRHWKGILKHRAAMERRLGTSLDLRVALFSFFVEIQRKLTNPKIIELHEFERTRDSAYTDQLTGLRNYRFFVGHLNHEVLRAEQYDTPLSLIMADIDRFIHFNVMKRQSQLKTLISTLKTFLYFRPLYNMAMKTGNFKVLTYLRNGFKTLVSMQSRAAGWMASMRPLLVGLMGFMQSSEVGLKTKVSMLLQVAGLMASIRF